MLGDLVEHQFEKTPGDEVSSGEIVGSVEGFKAISDLYSQIGGVFVEENILLSSVVELISR